MDWKLNATVLRQQQLKVTFEVVHSKFIASTFQFWIKTCNKKPIDFLADETNWRKVFMWFEAYCGYYFTMVGKSYIGAAFLW